MKTRPWIWIVVANLLFMAGIGTLVTVAVRHQMKEVPTNHGR